MKEVIISKRKLQKLNEFYIDPNTWNNESIFFEFSNNQLLKLYIYEDPDYLKDKEKNVRNLITFTKENDIPEIVSPTGILTVNHKFRGIILPKIEGKNARVYLESKDIPIKVKIEILKQIGTILEKINKTNPKYNAAFADVHNDNFIVSGVNTKNLSQMKTYGLDAESMKMLSSRGRLNFYITGNDNIKDFEKYGRYCNTSGMASYQTDLFCFIMMIIETIANDSHIYKYSIEEFEDYLEYLSLLGFNNELLTLFSKVYIENEDNVNPISYLDYLDKINVNSTWNAFLNHKTLAIKPKL